MRPSRLIVGDVRQEGGLVPRGHRGPTGGLPTPFPHLPWLWPGLTRVTTPAGRVHLALEQRPRVALIHSPCRGPHRRVCAETGFPAMMHWRRSAHLHASRGRAPRLASHAEE